MSVRTRSYVLWGLILDYASAKEAGLAHCLTEDHFYDLLEQYDHLTYRHQIKEGQPEINRKHGTTVLFDGMGGKYVAVGHVIAHTDENGDFPSGAGYIPSLFGLMPDEVKDVAAEILRWQGGIRSAMEDMFGQAEIACVDNKPVGFYVLTHAR